MLFCSRFDSLTSIYMKTQLHDRATGVWNGWTVGRQMRRILEKRKVRKNVEFVEKNRDSPAVPMCRQIHLDMQ
jgi:hypothetical protein